MNVQFLGASEQESSRQTILTLAFIPPDITQRKIINELCLMRATFNVHAPLLRIPRR